MKEERRKEQNRKTRDRWRRKKQGKRIRVVFIR